MAQRQLNIRSEEAVERAGRLAKALGQTTTRVVEDALRDYEAKASPLDERGFTPDQRRRFDVLMALADKARANLLPGADWDDSWMYDEDGLPK